MFAGLFPDTAWEILLCLYVASRDGRALSRRNLGALVGQTAAEVAVWLSELEENGAVRCGARAPDATAEITAKAATGLEEWLVALAAGAHPSGARAVPPACSGPCEIH